MVGKFAIMYTPFERNEEKVINCLDDGYITHTFQF